MSININKTFRLDNKVAIITGASKGIGKAIALALGQQGAKLIIASRKQDAVDSTAAEFREEGIDATGIAAHMGDMVQVKTLVEKTLGIYGGIDIIVNNAAINPVFGPILNTDTEVFDKIMDVNVKGPLELCKLSYHSMKTRGGGSVINISSIEGLTPGLGLGLYSISKATLIAATKVLAKEWGSDKIRANVICPGLIQTKFSEALPGNDKILKLVLAKQALPQLATPEDIAGLALFLASEASSFCTGAVYTADGGYTI
jgi:NAD(P)-dependent dehydrogenase (short-subunit alcohol dehydrogenase family)